MNANMNANTDIRFDPDKLIKSIVSAATTDGVVKPEHFHYQKPSADRPMIIVAAAPRSGSTFLTNVLSQITRLRYFRLCSGYSTNEHDLYLPALCFMNDTGCVSQMHMKGTFHNASLINLFGIKPLILVRDIFDTAVSLLYDLRQKENLPGYEIGSNGYSFLWMDKNTKSMDDDMLLDLIIDLAIPWYVNFYVSWYRLMEQKGVSGFWVNYEHLMADKENAIRSILKYIEFPFEGNIDLKILEQKFDTFHKGGSGRGRKILSNERQERIRKLFSYYPDVDFSRYGLH